MWQCPGVCRLGGQQWPLQGGAFKEPLNNTKELPCKDQEKSIPVWGDSSRQSSKVDTNLVNSWNEESLEAGLWWARGGGAWTGQGKAGLGQAGIR